MGDFTAKGMSDVGTDFIQFLSEDDAGTYMKAAWVDPEAYGEEWGGWWDASEELFVTPLNDQTLPAGTGFLCLFPSGNTVTFGCAGEVEHGRVISTEDNDNPGIGKKSPFICNPLPVDLTLGQITAKGMSDVGTDFIQFLSDTDAGTYKKAAYVDPEAYGEEWGGWWDAKEELFVTPANDWSLPAGAAVLCLFPSKNVVVFEFPDPLAAKTAE